LVDGDFGRKIEVLFAAARSPDNLLVTMTRLFLLGLLFAGIRAAIGASALPNSELSAHGPSTELRANPMPAREVVAKTPVPPGFRLSLVAAEPDVHQPIAMATDAQGRLWVAENDTYAGGVLGFHSEPQDRIVVFEDPDHDGRFNKRTVFWAGAERLTSVEVGLGGVWALALPKLVFIPDENEDLVPDGPPQVMLDGFEYQAGRHTVANGLRWGPDGWLYGRHGIQSTSRLGPPGAKPEARCAMNVGLWRYHPSRHLVEVVAQGTTNPWGMDWDARGELFFINTVIGHLWHVIPGAHYRRMYGEDPTPNTYELIEQSADHVHWATGESWTDVRQGVTDVTSAAGGGHAHTGLLIYQGGQWPAAWQDKLLTINFHGRRLNVEQLERAGSGFAGRHRPDAFLFADPWFRGIDLVAAPDGSVFVSDWSDTGECHDNDGVHRASGRIYQLSYGKDKPRPPFALTTLSDLELAGLQSSRNDWQARQARRVLADRSRRGNLSNDSRRALQQLAASDTNEVTRLRALWALHVSGGVENTLLRAKLKGSEAERAWALRLLEDARHTNPDAGRTFEQWLADEAPAFARSEPSALVRVTLASLLQKLPLTQRSQLAQALLSHGEDADDHNVPLMLWYGIEGLATTEPDFPGWLAAASIPRVQRLGARRLADAIDAAPGRVDALLRGLAKVRSAVARQAVLDGLADGFAGRRRVAKPASWASVERELSAGANESLQVRLRDLSALFGDGRALGQIQEVALNPDADRARRRAALQSLIEARADGLRAVCEQLLPVRDLSATAASGLALFDDPAIAERLLAEWPKLYGHERPPVMNALLSRPGWAGKLVEAIAAGKVRRNELGVAQARQIRAFNNAALNQRLAEVWGVLQDTDPSTREAALKAWRLKLTPGALQHANVVEGQKLFTTTCGACHKLYGSGGSLGPDLTGAGRQNLDYLLENMLFPSAVVPAEFRQTTLALKDGRTLSGVIRSRTPQTLVIDMIGESARINRADIEEETTSALSLMPEGQLDALTDSQAADLVVYLMSTAPPAPPRTQ
jgi:putative membrane-bound dehydrogenase-like protein